MTTEELKQHKAQLQSDIQDLVVAFQEKTKIEVSSIEVVKLDVSSKCGAAFLTAINVKLDL
jgi:hypothetical protein